MAAILFLLKYINSGQNRPFFAHVTLKIDRWHWKTHPFVAISPFKLELQFGNTQFGSKSEFFIPCHLEIWRMALRNNSATCLCYYKLNASFHNQRLIQTRVTVWKRTIWVKIGDFWSRVTLQFDGWPWITIGHLFYATSNFMHLFVAVCEFKLEFHFMIMRWQENCGKIVTDRQTDGQTYRKSILRAAWSQLK